MNKEKVYKGIKTLGFILLLMFTGPVIIHSAFKNQDHVLYIPVLIVGISICISAIVLGFRGINKMVDGIFNK